MVSLICGIEFLNDTNEFFQNRSRITVIEKQKPSSYQRENMAVVGRAKSGGLSEHIYTIICKIGNQQGPPM